MWNWARQIRLHSSELYKKQAARRCTKGPMYLIGQNVWLSAKDFPLGLDRGKLTSKFIGPFSIAFY